MWMTRWLPAPTGVVYDAWMDPAVLQQWFTFGGEPTSVTVQPHDTFVIHERHADDEVSHFGTYHEMWRPHRLEFSWSAPAYFAGESTVTVSFVAIEDETLLTVGVIGAPDVRTEQAWHRMLDRLRTALGSPK
jgi:uncharacterized protein YndB with AHSA1/START domain